MPAFRGILHTLNLALLPTPCSISPLGKLGALEISDARLPQTFRLRAEVLNLTARPLGHSPRICSIVGAEWGQDYLTIGVPNMVGLTLQGLQTVKQSPSSATPR